MRTYPLDRNSPGKLGLMPDSLYGVKDAFSVSLKDGLAAYQLVGEVKAHQGNDG